MNLGVPGENIHLYFVESQNIQSGRSHSNDFIQPLDDVKKIRKPRVVLILTLKVSCARKPLSPEIVGHPKISLDLGLLIID